MAKLTISTTVDPFPLPVKDIHLEGIFGNLSDVIEARVMKLRAKPTSLNAELIRFWEYALENLDPALHARIQRKYLTKDRAIGISGLEGASRELLPDMLKYIDPIIWLEGKLRLCRELGLHVMPPLRILDIGTGPGHFPFVARFFGHSVVGTDLPEEVNDGKENTYLYDDLCRLYGVKRVPLRIQAMKDLPDIGERFDVVTSFLTAFNTHKDPRPEKAKEKGRPWAVEDWKWFVASCFRVWLKNGGRLAMSLAKGKMTEESWSYLDSISSKSDGQRLILEISEVSELECEPCR